MATIDLHLAYAKACSLSNSNLKKSFQLHHPILAFVLSIDRRKVISTFIAPEDPISSVAMKQCLLKVHIQLFFCWREGFCILRFAANLKLPQYFASTIEPSCIISHPAEATVAIWWFEQPFWEQQDLEEKCMKWWSHLFHRPTSKAPLWSFWFCS